MSADQLRRAYELIRQGQKKDAIAILQPILKADRSNADAWWLLANALADPQKQEQALTQLLKLRPNDERAQKMLGRVQAQLRAKEDEFSFPVSDDDPFASASRGSSSFRSSDDPFADVPETVEDSSDDPFAHSADPFARAAGEKPKRGSTTYAAPPPKKQDNPVVMILAIIGVFAVGCCVISAILISRGIVQFGEIMATSLPQIMETITYDPNFNFSSGGSFDRGDARSRGDIAPGQTVNNTVDTFDDDYYTLTLSNRTQLTIDVIGRGDLDPQLYIYDSRGDLVAENDDINLSNDNLNSRLSLTLDPGTYYVVVSAFGNGGDYQINISR